MEPRTITFGRRAWIALGLFAVLMIGLLAGQVVLAVGQIEHIDRQRDVAEAQRETVLDLLAGGRDLAGELDESLDLDLPDLRRGAQDASDLVRESQPLVEDLNRYDAGRALAAVGAVAAQLADGGRLVALVDRANHLIARVQELDNPGDVEALRADTKRLRRLTVRTVRMQRELLAIQRETLPVLRESLTVQRETLTHARSIDRKTGPTLPGR